MLLFLRPLGRGGGQRQQHPPQRRPGHGGQAVEQDERLADELADDIPLGIDELRQVHACGGLTRRSDVELTSIVQERPWRSVNVFMREGYSCVVVIPCGGCSL